VVAADGGGSPTRVAAGVGCTSFDYGQTAVVCVVELGEGVDEGARGTAWQRFLPMGPVAVLPLSGRKASIVWSTTPSHAKALAALDGPSFLASLNRVLHATEEEFVLTAAAAGRGGVPSSAVRNFTASVAGFVSRLAPTSASHRKPPTPTSLISPILSFPLKLQLAHATSAPRCALLGDAAHVIHPLAGQGLNMGVRDCKALAAALERGVALGEDCGSAGVLRDYQASVALGNNAMAAGVHGIAGLFRGVGEGGWESCLWGPGGAFPTLRTLGLAAVAATPLVREAFSQAARS